MTKLKLVAANPPRPHRVELVWHPKDDGSFEAQHHGRTFYVYKEDWGLWEWDSYPTVREHHYSDRRLQLYCGGETPVEAMEHCCDELSQVTEIPFALADARQSVREAGWDWDREIAPALRYCIAPSSLLSLLQDIERLALEEATNKQYQTAEERRLNKIDTWFKLP